MVSHRKAHICFSLDLCVQAWEPKNMRATSILKSRARFSGVSKPPYLSARNIRMAPDSKTSRPKENEPSHRLTGYYPLLEFAYSTTFCAPANLRLRAPGSCQRDWDTVSNILVPVSSSHTKYTMQLSSTVYLF